MDLRLDSGQRSEFQAVGGMTPVVHQPLDRLHGPRVNELIREMARGSGPLCLSEHSFANLWLFRREHRYHFTDGPWPFISGLTYDGVHHAMPLFSLLHAPAAVIDALLAQHDCIYPVPVAQASQIDPLRFRYQSSRDDADYLYPADNFRHYRGSLLNKKRNLMRQLLRHHHVEATPYGASWYGAAVDVLSAWMQEKGKPAGGADEQPCKDALADAASLGLEGFGYTVDGQPAGFVLAEALEPGVYAMRFAKSLGCFKGLAQYMFHHFCTERTDVVWLNFEQDLGLSNFRQTKQSYQPDALLDKCRVTARTPSKVAAKPAA